MRYNIFGTKQNRAIKVRRSVKSFCIEIEGWKTRQKLRSFFFRFHSHVAVEVLKFRYRCLLLPGEKLGTMGLSTAEGCTRALSSGCFRHFMWTINLKPISCFINHHSTTSKRTFPLQFNEFSFNCCQIQWKWMGKSLKFSSLWTTLELRKST